MIHVFKNKPTRLLILVMSGLVVLGISIASLYYKKQNQSVDPRVKKARLLYEKYNDFAQAGAYDSIFQLLDTIEHLYQQYPHYENSFETGVLYNNRAAAWLTLATLTGNTAGEPEKRDSLLDRAEKNARQSIKIYQSWKKKFDDKNKKEIETVIRKSFFQGLEKYDQEKKQLFLARRAEEIAQSKVETDRRLSVSYTNLGLVYRHKSRYEEAARQYKKAMELWDRNLTAENNLNRLLGRPLKKRNIIQKLFPPAKDN
jgi:tetratricopeptide (TPR) repeat protein